jgi:hypothetical protein
MSALSSASFGDRSAFLPAAPMKGFMTRPAPQAATTTKTP